MKKIVLIVFILFPLYGLCQKNTTVSGYIFDAETNEPLIGANIFEVSSKNGTISNEFGFYSLSFPKNDSSQLIISFIGYNTLSTKTITSDHFSFYLIPGIDLEEVTVSKNKKGDFIRSNETGIIKLQAKQIKELPNFFGEADIIKTLQLTPGIQSGGEANSNLYVRGGSPDQNLILLDGQPLYYVAHFGGFISIFNTDAISDVTMIKGGFPARYGNRLSSVLDIRMKEGNLKKYSGQGTIGLLSSKISFEGPLIKDKSSFIISARKNLLPLIKIVGAGFDYRFSDINAKLNYKVSEKDKLFLSFYLGNDDVNIKNSTSYNNTKQNDKRSTKWGNILGALSWNHIFSNKLFSNNTLSYTSYNYTNDFYYALNSDSVNTKIDSKINSGITDIILKSDFTWYVDPKYHIKFGQATYWHKFIPNAEDYLVEVSDQPTVDTSYASVMKAFESALFFENNLQLKHFGANLGIRLSSYYIHNQTYFSIEPRILLNLILTESFSIKYSFSKMNQNVHLLSYSGVGMPSDYWMPSNQIVKPEKSFQNTIGINKSLRKGKYEISLESYYKKMDNLIAFKPGKSLISHLGDWTSLIEKEGIGKSYGVEFLFQKITGKTTGWLGTTISKSTRKFQNLNNGKIFPFKYDRMFDASLVITHKISENITLSGNWTFGSGYPVTLPTERYFSDIGDIYVYENINAFRMRDYHRLDLAINFKAKTSWGERIWTISFFNVYNRKNPYFYFFQHEYLSVPIEGGHGITGVLGDMHLYQKSLFPFFPSFAYSFKF